MGEILDTVIRFLHEDSWPYTPIEGQPIIQTGFQGDNGQWTCYAQAREEHEQCIIYSACPVNVPENKRIAVAELLTRVNYGLIIGNFEMDFQDGEIRYKTSIDVQDEQLTPTLVRNIVYTNVMTMDRYLPAIMTVLYGSLSPAEAIAQVEGTD
jgi:hypothetical protein